MRGGGGSNSKACKDPVLFATAGSFFLGGGGGGGGIKSYNKVTTWHSTLYPTVQSTPHNIDYLNNHQKPY